MKAITFGAAGCTSTLRKGRTVEKLHRMLMPLF
jgi:hypothetical protein